MTVAIIDYGSGNLRSAAKAFEKAASATGHRILVTNKPADLRQSTHIVLPGVGAFADCMQGLTSLPGMREALEEEVRAKKKPFLGICVGMQLMLERGFEHGEHQGLGWIEGEVVKIESRLLLKNSLNSGLQTPDSYLKIPHMGWNELIIRSSDHPIIRNIQSGDHAYFVHSYHARCRNRSDILCTTEYGEELTAAIARDNMIGVQFHPEKSQATGLRLIENFLRF